MEGQITWTVDLNGQSRTFSGLSCEDKDGKCLHSVRWFKLFAQ